MQSFDSLDEHNILKFIYGKNYNKKLNRIDLEAKNSIHPNFDEIIDSYIESNNPEYQTYSTFNIGYYTRRSS